MASVPPKFALAHDGVRIAWREDGAPTSPAILLCSIGTAAMSVWDNIVTPLSAIGRVIRYDRRGDGDSDLGTEKSHTFSTYAADAVAVLDAAGCERAAICGMAFGARVALRLALDAPQRVGTLVLFDATGGPPAPEKERIAGQQEAARLRRAAGLNEFARERRWFHRRHAAGAIYSRNAFLNQPSWIVGAATITARTLVACGDCDPNLTGAQRLAHEIPNARFERMPMTGHASILERPELVLSLLTAFAMHAHETQQPQ